MLYLVRMDVTIPTELPQAETEAAKAQEKALAQDLQRDGRWAPFMAGSGQILQLLSLRRRQ